MAANKIGRYCETCRMWIEAGAGTEITARKARHNDTTSCVQALRDRARRLEHVNQWIKTFDTGEVVETERAAINSLLARADRLEYDCSDWING